MSKPTEKLQFNNYIIPHYGGFVKRAILYKN